MLSFVHALYLLKLCWIWTLKVEAAHYARYQNFTSSVIPASADCFKCGIEAPGGVRLIYWAPDDAYAPSNYSLTPGQTYTQVENGFTFTSPSVYVVFTGLQATQSCGSTDIRTFSPSFAEKTLAYSSSFLAYGTVLNPGPNCDEYEVAGGFHTINFSNLYYTPIVTSTISKEGCPPIVNPRVSLPAELTNVAPSWASCEPLFYGAWDPPSAITKASQLAPVRNGGNPVTAVEAITTPTVPALAEAVPTPDLAQSTATTTPPQIIAQNAALSAQADPQNAPPRQTTPPTNDASNDQQKAPADPAPAESQSSNVDENDANQNSTPDGSAQPQAISYNPQEGGFDPVPAKVVQSAAAVLATPTRPGDQPGYQDDSHQQGIESTPDLSHPDSTQPSGNTPISSNDQNVATNQQASQKEPAPLIIDPNGKVLVNSGSMHAPAAQDAVPNPVAPPTVSLDSGGGIYVPPIHPAVEKAPSQVSVASDGKIYAPSIIVGEQSVAGSVPPLSIGGHPAQVAPNGALHIAGQTISSGAQGTVDGFAVSVGLTNVIVGGKTQALPIAVDASPASNTLPPSIGGDLVRIAPHGALVVGSKTLPRGHQATFAGAVVSVGSDHVAVDGSTYPLPVFAVPTPSTALAPLMVAGESIQKANNGRIIVAGQTVAQDRQATVAGTVVSVGEGNIVFGSSTYALPANTPPAVGGQVLTPAPSGGLVVGGQLVAPGQQATIAGTVISVGSSNVVIEGNSYALPRATATVPPTTALSIGGQAIKITSAGGLIVGSQSIPQNIPTTISGTFLSAGPSNIIIGSTTLALPSDSTPIPTQAPLLIAGQPVHVATNGKLIIGSHTLVQGSHTTIANVAISVAPDALIVDGTTLALNPTGTAVPSHVPNDKFIITNGEPINEGDGVTTYNGPAVSGFVTGGDIVIGSATLPLPASMTGRSVSQGALGGLILSALGNGGLGDGTAGSRGPSLGATGSVIGSEHVAGRGSRGGLGRYWMLGGFVWLGFLVVF